MEDVSDAVFRRLCRGFGAELCVTEFVAAEQLISDSKLARRRAALDPGADAEVHPEAGAGAQVKQLSELLEGMQDARDPALVLGADDDVVEAVLPGVGRDRLRNVAAGNRYA